MARAPGAITLRTDIRDSRVAVVASMLMGFLPPDRVVTLLIDDEEMIRALLHRILEPEICRALEAADGESGLRIVERDDPHVDIVLTELFLPGLNGWDIIEVLAAHRPDVQVAIVTAFSRPIFERSRQEHISVISKPFTRKAVQSVARDLAARAREAKARDAHRIGSSAPSHVKEDLVSAALAIHQSRSGFQD